jgi:phage-related protein
MDYMKQEFNWHPIVGGYFAFYDNDKLIILLNGFTKKTQKTPKNEIKKALGLMNKYYLTKNN